MLLYPLCYYQLAVIRCYKVFFFIFHKNQEKLFTIINDWCLSDIELIHFSLTIYDFKSYTGILWCVNSDFLSSAEKHSLKSECHVNPEFAIQYGCSHCQH